MCLKAGLVLWQQERETVGHVSPTFRKPREINAGTQLAFSFFKVSLDPQPMEQQIWDGVGSPHGN